MRSILLACILLINGLMAGHAQKNLTYRDSLLRIASQPKLDSNKANALVALQRYYFETGRYDSTLWFAKKAMSLINEINDPRKITGQQYSLGMIFTLLSKYDSGDLYLDKVGEKLSTIKDTSLIINYYNARATLSNYQSDYASAVEYLISASQLIDHSGNPKIKKWLPQNYGNISYNLLAQKEYEKAITYSNKALQIKDYPSEGRYRILVYLNIVDAYLRLDKPEMAFRYLDSARILNKPLGNAMIDIMVANNEGFYYETTHDYSTALESYLRSYRQAEKANSPLLKAEAGDNIAHLYFTLRNYEQSEKYALETNQSAKQLRRYTLVASTYGYLKDIAAAKKNFNNAFSYSELQKAYADSAVTEETRKTALALESKYQNQKKENEIVRLTNSNMEKELAIARRNRWLIAGSILVVAALVVLGLLYKNSRQKQLLAEREQLLQNEHIQFLERQQQIVSLQSMINGQEAERTRIAKDLHDGLGGLFSTVKMYFSTMQHDTPELVQSELFNKSYTLVDTASEEVRRIAHNMMPEVLMKLGLINALKDLCDNISAGKLLHVSLEVHGMNGRLNATTEIMLFRIIQELLNNIIKHAQASEAIIQFIREDSRLSVIVEDNGRGFNSEEADIRKHVGIATIQSRVDYLNGKMSIDSERNVGTTIMMDFLINEG